MQFFDVKEHSPSILLKMLISDTYKINGLAVSLVGNSIKTISTLVLGYSLSIGYDWRIGLIALAFLPFMVLAYIFQGKASLKLAHSSDKLENDSASIISSSICNSKTFISYKMQDKIKQIFKENIKKNEKFVFKYSLWNGVSYAITGLIMFVLFGVVLYSGSTFIFSFNKPVTIPNYLKSCFTIILGIFGISQGQLYAVDTVDAKKSMENIFNIFNIIPKNQEITIEGLDIYDKDIENKNSLNINNIPSLSKERYSENKHNLNILGKIEFRDVGFKYDEKKSDFCLENLNFTIEPGQKVAIVGSSGSGKSTIFSLLERFYLVNSGQILIDNKNIQEYDLSFLRKEVLGYMLENPAVFKRSIKENILYGNFSAEEKDIERLCDLLKIKYLLERENYSTNNKFSSGEQQRISLARVLVKKPKVILLDEPTATLDNESEIYVQNFLDNHFKNTTVICIAHRYYCLFFKKKFLIIIFYRLKYNRLKTIMNSDFIIFMDQGRIVEKGTHKELMELKGKYYELFNHGVSF